MVSGWVSHQPALSWLRVSEFQAQRWLLRPCSGAGVAPAVGQNPDREAHHTPQLGGKATPPSCFTPRSFHHLSNNGSTLGPRNQLPSLERQGPEGQSRSKAAQISRAHTHLAAPYLPQGLHVPDTREWSREQLQTRPGGLGPCAPLSGLCLPRARISCSPRQASLACCRAHCIKAAPKPPAPHLHYLICKKLTRPHHLIEGDGEAAPGATQPEHTAALGRAPRGTQSVHSRVLSTTTPGWGSPNCSFPGHHPAPCRPG